MPLLQRSRRLWFTNDLGCVEWQYVANLDRSLLLALGMKNSIVLFVPIAVLSLVSEAKADDDGKKHKPRGMVKDTALMGAYVPGTGGVGGGLVFEPKWEVVDNLYAGFRTAIAITGGGSISSASSDVSVGVGVNVSAMGKVEYSVPSGSVRPVVGLGLGMYYLISQEVSAGTNTSVRQQAGEFFGLAPQVGIELGRARLAATYNAVLGANVEVVQTVGAAPKNTRQDYVSLELGMRF